MLSHFSHVQRFATLWTVAHQPPLSMDSLGKYTGVSCQFLLQEIFLIQGLNLHLVCLALVGRFFITESLGKPISKYNTSCYSLV